MDGNEGIMLKCMYPFKIEIILQRTLVVLSLQALKLETAYQPLAGLLESLSLPETPTSVCFLHHNSDGFS